MNALLCFALLLWLPLMKTQERRMIELMVDLRALVLQAVLLRFEIDFGIDSERSKNGQQAQAAATAPPPREARRWGTFWGTKSFSCGCLMLQ